MPVRLLLGLLLVLGLALGVPGGAPASGPAAQRQPPGLDPRLAVTQYAAQAWGLEDGLPQSVVEAVAQTADGHVWLGTQEGLARFDGARFEAVDAHGAEGLTDNRILAFAPAADSGLWAGTRDGGLVHLDRDLRVTPYGEAHGLGGTVAALAADARGRVWAGTREGLCVSVAPAVRAEAASRRFRCFGAEAGLDDPYVRRLALGRDGAVWLGTRAGLFRFARGRATSLAALGGAAAEPITALHEDAAGGLWVGSMGGLGYLRGGALVTPPEAERFAGVEVSALWEDRAGSLWVGTAGQGLVRLRDGQADGLAEAAGTDVSTVRALVQDREGSLWVGTAGGGLVRLRDARFTPVGTPEGLPADAVFSVAADSGGVWVGTDHGVARIQDGRVTRRLTQADGLPSDDVTTVLATRDGALWVGTGGAGLCRWAAERMACYDAAGGLPDPFVNALFESRDGTLWVGTDAGPARWNGRTFEPLGEGAPEAPVVSFAQAADGALWIGTYGEGLFRGAAPAAGGPRAAFTHHPDLAGAIVFALHARADGALWVGTSGDGLARVRADGRGGFTSDRFTTREGLLSDAVLQILEDGQGRLWLSSNRGIARVGLDELDRVARGEAREVRPTVYDGDDGLRSAECNGGGQPAGAVSPDGALWFPTAEGVATIHPARIRTNPLAPPVAVQRVLVNERAVPLAAGGPLVLPAGSRAFAFEYAGLSFFAPGEVRHRYRLDGRDDEWTEAGARRTAFYTDLAPGGYTFRVQAANNDGVWNEAGGAVAFTLRPHFWQTTWFLVLCVVAALGAAFAVVRARVAQLKARAAHLEQVVEERTHSLKEALDEVSEQKAVIEGQAEELVRLDAAKTQFFNNISHEFRTPLTLTIGPLENALGDAYGPLTSAMRRQMEMMLRNSRRLLRLINQLLDVAKLESGKMKLQARRGDVRTLVEMVTRSFEGFAEEHQLGLDLVIPDHAVPLTFEADKLEKVFFNLLSNSIKYTPAGGTITVAVGEAEASEAHPEGAVVVRVTDTGKGIEAEALPHIFDRFHQAAGSDSAVQASTGIGLSLVQELVELHGGAITVESTLGVGTTFAVTLPKGTAHLRDEDLEAGAFEEPTTEGPSTDARMELAKVEADYRSRKEHLPANYQGDGATFGDAAGGDGQAGLPPDAELVLLVEDNPDIRAYVRDCLLDRYRIAEAGDGEAGLEAARRLRPDLIVSDVMMPRMDGYTMCRLVKADPDIGHTPLILLTAKADEGQRVEGLELGADDYMAKPFNARELRARVHNTLLIKRQERELAALNADLEAKVREQLAELIKKSRLQKYFPQKLVQQILQQEGEVRVFAERKRVTVFFSDLTGFTKMSDTNPPEVVTRLLNEYLNTMVPLIEAHGGTLDKFMGDGLMVLFGAADAMPPEGQARQAVAMGVAMQRALADLRTKWEAEGLTHHVGLRIGINQDDVTVGNFGSDDLVEYTAIGGGVNLASRLEGACKPGGVLVAFPVFALAKGAFAFGEEQAYTLKGLAEPVPAFLIDPETVAEEAEA